MEYRVLNQNQPLETDFLLLDFSQWQTDRDRLSSGRMYHVFFLKEGEGILTYEFNCYRFSAPCALFISAYQPFKITANKSIHGDVLLFATDFFCIDHNHSEVGCQGLLFNNTYESPFISLDSSLMVELEGLTQKIKEEFSRQQEPDPELIATYIKLFLKISAREKKLQVKAAEEEVPLADKPLLVQLRTLIEQHYRMVKSPSEYADKLHISPKALGKLVKENFGRTLTEMIRERVVYEAKHQLFNTTRPVKEIANDLGYDDPLYFSRLFKNVTSVSPEKYRQTIHY